MIGATDLVIGANVQDYSGYPDCRPEFLRAFADVARLGTRAGAEGGTVRGPRAAAPPVQGGHCPARPGPGPRLRAHPVVRRPAGAIRPLRALRRLPPPSRRVPGGGRSRPLHLRRLTGLTSLAVAGHGRCMSLASMGWIARRPRESRRRLTAGAQPAPPNEGDAGGRVPGLPDVPPVRASVRGRSGTRPVTGTLMPSLREPCGCLSRITVGPGLLPCRNETTETG